MMFRHDNLLNFMQTNFNLVKFHNYSFTELENMMPWERIVYIDLLNEYEKREAEYRRDLQAAQNARRGF